MKENLQAPPLVVETIECLKFLHTLNSSLDNGRIHEEYHYTKIVVDNLIQYIEKITILG